MKTYLYRPVAAKDVYAEYGEGTLIYEGEVLGPRRTGYLSRSSAAQHGEESGIEYRIERSNPISFGTPEKTPEQRATERRARLGAALADLVLAGNKAAAKVVARELIRDTGTAA